MIDIHAHILYGIDDGARHEEMTLNMLRKAEKDCIRAVIATPHYVAGADIYHPDALPARYNEVVGLIEREGINIELHLGNELFLDEYILGALINKKCHTLANTRYVLLELPMANIPLETENVLYQFLARGYRPIIAHPERNAAILRDPAALLPLLKMGCLAQINSGSITGGNGRRIQEISKLLLESNMGHIVASDCHSDRRRPPILSKAYEKVSSWLGQQRAEKLFKKNPETLLRDEKIEIGCPRLIQKERGLAGKIMAYLGAAR